MYVMKRPQYVSEVMDPTPEPAAAGPTPEPSAAGPTPDPIIAMYADASADDFPFAEIQSSAWRSIRYKAILEPKIMSAVLKKRSEDRIPY
jgi:hypothetical protein